MVEESSSEAALTELLPKILRSGITWQINPHQGKQDLIKKLPNRLKGFSEWLPEDWYIFVLIDKDKDDCLELKQKLEQIATDANLKTKGSQISGRIQVVNRIAIEEFEAWFFGDITALSTAFPGVPDSLSSRAKFRNPDAIPGGTWEALEIVLQKAGYYRSGLQKIDAAKKIAGCMNPSANLSSSFCCFRDALYELNRTG
jgi:hypothetical protein